MDGSIPCIFKIIRSDQGVSSSFGVAAPGGMLRLLVDSLGCVACVVFAGEQHLDLCVPGGGVEVGFGTLGGGQHLDLCEPGVDIEVDFGVGEGSREIGTFVW